MNMNTREVKKLSSAGLRWVRRSDVGGKEEESQTLSSGHPEIAVV